MLVDIFLPTRTLGYAKLLAATTLLVWPEAPVLAGPSCPMDMVQLGPSCVDRFPLPNLDGEEVLLGVSALPELYLGKIQGTWDCTALCEQRGKRLCRWGEWKSACEGTPENACGGIVAYRKPDWSLVMSRKGNEIKRLDQHARAAEVPNCESKAGVRLMTTVQEWVTLGDGYAFSRGFWSRAGGCDAINTAHAPNWHDYATACRCCKDARP